MKEEIKWFAFEEYGKCIGCSDCEEEVKFSLIEKYHLSEKEAGEYVAAAYEEWVEAYS